MITDFAQYAWEYFRYHARQRLTTFNFYIIICSLVATGYVAAVKNSETTPRGVVLGALLAFLSFVFWQLDRRNKELIHNSEDALKLIERDTPVPDADEDPPLQHIFRYEEKKTECTNSDLLCWPWAWRLSYSQCFGLVSLSFGLLGSAGTVYAIALMWLGNSVD